MRMKCLLACQPIETCTKYGPEYSLEISELGTSPGLMCADVCSMAKHVYENEVLACQLVSH